MGDFREEIARHKSAHTKAELVDVLADELGERATSVNPLTEAMFSRVAPEFRPTEYARKADGHREDARRVAQNATALKLLLHEQVGRPRYDRVLTLKKQDFAECLAAVRAFDDGVERAVGVHAPTTLPLDVEEVAAEPPKRTRPTEPLGEPITALTEGYQRRLATWLDSHTEIANSPYTVYVLDCTPDVGDDEHEMVADLRRAVHAKLEAGIPRGSLTIKERAAAELNDDNRLYYVGSTGDLEKRIDEHETGAAASGVDFTTNFRPRRLVDVRSASTEGAAKQLEGERAREIDRQTGRFAYSDEL